MAVPELSGPAEIYYNQTESEKYHRNTRITKIQRKITLRALELLDVKDEPSIILDLGCGSGLSGQAINELGHDWIGLDLSPAMLEIAHKHTTSVGLIKHDLGTPLPFKEDSFDYAVSISAVQWLFQSYEKDHHPLKRIKAFFKGLYFVVRKRAVIQFYCSKKETEILRREAKSAGFYGGTVVDNEGTKNSKLFLVLDKTAPPKERTGKLIKKSKRPKAVVE